MGQLFVEYLFPDSARDEWVLWSSDIHYRLADRSKLHILQRAAWCAACGRFVIAEEVPSVEALEEEIGRYRSADPEILLMWEFLANRAPLSERVSELLRYVEWRQGRRGPPRCLECGAIDPVPVPTSGEFAHPGTGERVVVGSSGFADAAAWFAEFSPEGELLPEPGAAADGVGM